MATAVIPERLRLVFGRAGRTGRHLIDPHRKSVAAHCRNCQSGHQHCGQKKKRKDFHAPAARPSTPVVAGDGHVPSHSNFAIDGIGAAARSQDRERVDGCFDLDQLTAGERRGNCGRATVWRSPSRPLRGPGLSAVPSRNLRSLGDRPPARASRMKSVTREWWSPATNGIDIIATNAGVYLQRQSGLCTPRLQDLSDGST